MKTNDIAAMEWLLKQQGLKLHVGKDEHVTLIYGFSFEIHANNLAEAVTALQESQVIKDNVAAMSCSGLVCQECFNCEATMQNDSGTYLCFTCYNAAS